MSAAKQIPPSSGGGKSAGRLDDLALLSHTGNEDGQTLRQWWEKVRPGGILAGHDYHPQWPKNLAAVDAFRQAHADHITQFQITADDPFPSWVAVKG